jgi:hypothetical protein
VDVRDAENASLDLLKGNVRSISPLSNSKLNFSGSPVLVGFGKIVGVGVIGAVSPSSGFVSFKPVLLLFFLSFSLFEIRCLENLNSKGRFPKISISRARRRVGSETSTATLETLVVVGEMSRIVDRRD